MAEDGFAHVLDDAGQFICTNVGMGIGEDAGAGAMLTEDAENLLSVAALLAAGVEFAVGVCACAALAKGVVALGVDALFGSDAGQVLLAVAHVLATLHHDGAQAQFDEP